MPAYNEEGYIEECFNRVVRTLERYGRTFEVVLEEDGSTDRTPEIIDRLARQHRFVKALHHPRRIGKGWGIQQGLRAAQGDVIVLIDSDGEYPPEKIPELIDLIDGATIVLGERRSLVRRHPIRVLLSLLYARFVNLFFGVDLPGDIQAGLKVFPSAVIDVMLPLRSNGFEIDSEMILKAFSNGFKVVSVPVGYTYKGRSKVNIVLDSIRILLSLLMWKIAS